MSEFQMDKKSIREGIERLNAELGAGAVLWKDFAHIVGRKTVVTRLAVEAVDEKQTRLVRYDFNLPRSGERIAKKCSASQFLFSDVIEEYDQAATLCEQDGFLFVSEKQSKLVELFSKPMYVNRIKHTRFTNLVVDSSRVIQEIKGGVHVFAKVNEFGETLIHDSHAVNYKTSEECLENPGLVCFLERLKKAPGFRGAFLEAFIDETGFTITDVHYCINHEYKSKFIAARLKELEERVGDWIKEFGGTIAMPVYQNESGIEQTNGTLLSRKAKTKFSAWNDSGDIGCFYCRLNALDLAVIEFNNGNVHCEYEDNEELTFDFHYPSKTSKSLRSDYCVTMNNSGGLLIF